jgi:hypothetical protein
MLISHNLHNLKLLKTKLQKMALRKLQHVYFCMLKLEGLKLVSSKLTMHIQTLNFMSGNHV